MALIKRKTKKALTKQVNKLIRKHGTEIAVGLVSNLMTGITAATVAKSDDDGEAPKKKRAKNGKAKKKKSKKKERAQEDDQPQDGSDDSQL